MLLFDASRADGRTTELQNQFRLVTDGVMGGMSRGTLTVETVSGRRGLRLTGHVRLENNGGFIQMATDLTMDASSQSVLRLTVLGNNETYGCHLRTMDVRRPWQSYRQEFFATETWSEVDLSLERFLPHRLDSPFDPAKLRRLGLVAIGRAFEADLTVSKIEMV
ncbi:MAG: CIA30 family protein [Myxococcota bacterium]